MTVSSDCDDNGSGTQGYAKFLTDGDLNTYWHSNWRGTGGNGDQTAQLPQFIQIDLGAEQMVQSIAYSPRVRPSGYKWTTMNGCALSYEVYVSNEAFGYTQSSTAGSVKTWYEEYVASHAAAVSGTFSYDDDTNSSQVWKAANLNDATSARYVMFVIKGSTGNNADSQNKFANCGEIYVSSADGVTAIKDIALMDATQRYDVANSKKSEDAVGYYNQSTLDAWKAALDAATTADEVNAITAAYKLKCNMPVAGKLYRIINHYNEFMNKQSVRKIMGGRDGAYVWRTEDNEDATNYWSFDSNSDGTFQLRNLFSGYVVNGYGTLGLNSSPVSLSAPTPGVLNLQVNGSGTMHASGHNNGSGVNGTVINYGTYGEESSGCSSWEIEEATLAELKAINHVTTSSAAVSYGGKDIYPVHSYNPESMTAFTTDIANATTLDEAYEVCLQHFPMLVPIEAGKYYRIVCPSPKQNTDHNTLSFNANSKVCTEVYDYANVNQLWTVNAEEGGYYSIQNANTEKYVGDVILTNGKRIDLTSDKNLFEVIEYTDQPTQFRIHQPGKPATNNLFAENGTDDNYACSTWENQSPTRAASWYFLPVDDIEVALTAVGDHSYATAHLPFAVSSVDGATAYTGILNDAKDRVALTETAAFAANEGVVLVGSKDQSTATLTIGGNAEKATENVFTGSNTEVSVTDDIRSNYRVLGANASDESEIGFFKPSATLTTISANRAFINLSDPALANVLTVGFGTTDGIGNAIAVPAENDAPAYDLTGRRVMHLVKGQLYIQGGKKLIAK